MSLTTLAAIKESLGISGTAEDARLKRLIRNASSIIRTYCGGRFFGGAISAATLANPTIVTSLGHGLQSGQAIIIAGSNTTPTIDGERVVTRIDEDTFSVPVNVTVAGTAGTYALKLTEYYVGNNSPRLVLRQTPVQSVAAVYEDDNAAYGEAPDAFAAESLLTAGEDYALDRSSSGVAEASLSGILVRIGASWPGSTERIRGLLASGLTSGVGNIKVSYVAGFYSIPYDLQSAVEQLVAEQRQSADRGGAMQSESFDYYSYTRMSQSEQAKAIGGVKGILSKYKPWSL